MEWHISWGSELGSRKSSLYLLGTWGEFLVSLKSNILDPFGKVQTTKISFLTLLFS